MKNLIRRCDSGQALVTLLFFIVVSVTITSAAIIVIILNSKSTSSVEQGAYALTIAESGAENALLRLLRNPGYTGEPLLNVGDGTATILVNGTSPTIITSEGKIGNFVRTIKVEVGYNEGMMEISSWKEI